MLLGHDSLRWRAVLFNHLRQCANRLFLRNSLICNVLFNHFEETVLGVTAEFRDL